MWKILRLVLAIALIPSLAFAECDWKTGVTFVEFNHYAYTKECHIKVGQTVQDLSNAKLTITELGKIIDLKNEEITAADQRTELWKVTSGKLEDKLDQVQRIERGNMWLYIGVGVIATGLVVAGVGQLKH